MQQFSRKNMPTTSVGMAPNAVHGWTGFTDPKELVFQDFEPSVRFVFF
jgi:hypothetical protein